MDNSLVFVVIITREEGLDCHKCGYYRAMPVASLSLQSMYYLLKDNCSCSTFVKLLTLLCLSCCTPQYIVLLHSQI